MDPLVAKSNQQAPTVGLFDVAVKLQQLNRAITNLEATIKKVAVDTDNPASSRRRNLVRFNDNEDSASLSTENNNILKPTINRLISVEPLNKVCVQVRVVFTKIGEIDTIRDRFNASVYLQAKWREEKLDGLCGHDLATTDVKKFWQPLLQIENVIAYQRESIDYDVTIENGLAYVIEKRKMVATFQEFMELQRFPFDTQDLTVTMTSERSAEEVTLADDSKESSMLNTHSFVHEQEWNLHKYIASESRVLVDSNSIPVVCHPAFSVRCKASRKPEFFIWNIFVVMFLICSLSFATFSVDLNLPQNRLQLSFILLLTTVSFKFAVNQSLPMIAYLTYLDKYILGSMAILCSICIWHAVVPELNDMKLCCSEASKKADLIALYTLAFVFAVFQAGFVCLIVVMTSKRRQWDQQTKIYPSNFSNNKDSNT